MAARTETTVRIPFDALAEIVRKLPTEDWDRLRSLRDDPTDGVNLDDVELDTWLDEMETELRAHGERAGARSLEELRQQLAQDASSWAAECIADREDRC